MTTAQTTTAKTTTRAATKAAPKTAEKKVSPKAAKNTPVAKTVTAPKAATAKTTVKKETKTKPVVKAETKPVAAAKATTKKGVFALVAGLAVKIEHKGLKQAIKYHVAKGSLKLTAAGVELTAQGAALWGAERVEKDPAKFQEFAAFIKGNAEVPSEWKGQPETKIAEGLRFPNMLYWGSFSTLNMRQAFAAIWAK